MLWSQRIKMHNFINKTSAFSTTKCFCFCLNLNKKIKNFDFDYHIMPSFLTFRNAIDYYDGIYNYLFCKPPLRIYVKIFNVNLSVLFNNINNHIMLIK